MKKLPKDKLENLMVYICAGCVIAIVYSMLNHATTVKYYFSSIMHILSPFFYGLLIALCMLPLARILEFKVLKDLKLKERSKRKLVTILTIIIFVGVIIGLIALVVPEIISAGQSIPVYISESQKLIESSYNTYPEFKYLLEMIMDFSDELLNTAVTWVKSFIPSLLTTGANILTVTLNLCLGFFMTFFYLVDRERFAYQIKKVLYAIFKKEHASKIVSITKVSGEMFDKFITGKLLDSLIIGILTFFVLIVFDIDYAVLIAVVVGITNVIPYFGPFFGAIPCALLLLLVDPIQSLKFIVMIFVIQQFDGNILGPYILGDSVKLQPFWILFSILVFGGLFGFLGMFLGVPVFATIIAIIKECVDYQLDKKQIDTCELK